MRVIALIDDSTVVRCILEHLGRWAPDWPQNAMIPITYHPSPTSRSPNASQDSRPFDLIDIAIGRAQAQYPMGTMLGGAK